MFNILEKLKKWIDLLLEHGISRWIWPILTNQALTKILFWHSINQEGQVLLKLISSEPFLPLKQNKCDFEFEMTVLIVSNIELDRIFMVFSWKIKIWVIKRRLFLRFIWFQRMWHMISTNYVSPYYSWTMYYGSI